MKTDINGCSTCPEGKEQFEKFYVKRNAKVASLNNEYYQYDFRYAGELFSTVASSLEICRARKDKWLIKMRKMNQEEIAEKNI